MIPDPSIELRDLRLVRAISSAKTTTAAAKLLGLSQSAISHQLRNLEERLECEVFQRQGRGLKIAPAGRRLLDLSQDVLDAVVAAESEIRASQSEAKRQLRVATQCYTAYHWLPQAMEAFQLEHDDIALTIVPSATAHPLRALQNDELDLALCIGSTKDRSFCQRRLFDDELVLITAPSHRLAGKRSVSGSDLDDEHLLLYTPTESTQRKLRTALFPRGGGFKKVSRVPLTEAIIEMVKANQGVSILTHWAVAANEKRGELACVPFKHRALRRKWVGTYRRDSELAAPIRTLLKILRDSGGPG